MPYASLTWCLCTGCTDIGHNGFIRYRSASSQIKAKYSKLSCGLNPINLLINIIIRNIWNFFIVFCHLFKLFIVTINKF